MYMQYMQYDRRAGGVHQCTSKLADERRHVHAGSVARSARLLPDRSYGRDEVYDVVCNVDNGTPIYSHHHTHMCVP